jgi:MFS family permease
MSVALSRPQTAARPVMTALLPLMAVVFVAFFVIGLAMPVLPLHVHQDLGFGTFMVGIVAGAQFAASLVSRLWAGHHADNRGAKSAVFLGLLAASAAGLLYFLSLRSIDSPFTSVSILLLGRAALGGAESFIITGATIWGLARVGRENAGTVIAWMGTAMFAAFAGGAPLGTALYQADGFAAIAAATVAAPLATLLLVVPLRPVAPEPQRRSEFLSVVLRIWMPGLGAALSSVGFGAITAFASLLFAGHGWSPVWLAFTAYAAALIVARVSFGHLPDRIGGAKVALYSVGVEAAGLALMWVAPSAVLATIGAALTGAGYSLVYPGFGVEAVRRTPPQARGIAMGAYTACLDIALGVSGPVLGLAASGIGLPAVFLISALVVLCAALVAVHIMRNRFSQV